MKARRLSQKSIVIEVVVNLQGIIRGRSMLNVDTQNFLNAAENGELSQSSFPSANNAHPESAEQSVFTPWPVTTVLQIQ